MFEVKSLPTIVQQYVRLDSPNAKGWYGCLHTKCDHGRKGNRAAFRFDGEAVTFHCFNCKAVAKYNPETDETMSPDMVDVLRDFGIPDEEWQPLVFDQLGKVRKPRPAGNTTQSLVEPSIIELPDHFYPMGGADTDDKWSIIARAYLADRSIDPDNYPFYLSTGVSKTDDKVGKWKGRVIIPVYKNNKLIYYQGRALVPSLKKKYENPAISKTAVMYNFDALHKDRTFPLYIMEGWFDAVLVNGVATYGNVLTKEQIAWLNTSPRQKVYIPDKFGDGIGAAEQALKLGWSVSVPDIGQCKDINSAVCRFGLLYVLNSMRENTYDGFEALTAIKLWCE